MQLDVSLTKKILITILIMLVLIAFVYYFNIPNPNMILIAGLVLCSALFGFGGGIVAAVIMLFYTFGYVHDHLNESVELRKLISAADERMYNAKRNK